MRRMGATNNIENLTDDFLRQYASQQEGISVNFRREFPFLNGTERYSHAIHPYPAKLITHIPYFFLNNKRYITPGETVLDLFVEVEPPFSKLTWLE